MFLVGKTKSKMIKCCKENPIKYRILFYNTRDILVTATVVIDLTK